MKSTLNEIRILPQAFGVKVEPRECPNCPMFSHRMEEGVDPI